MRPGQHHLRPCFGQVPGHPQLVSDTPRLASMLMDPRWREAAEFLLAGTDIRLGPPADGGQRAIGAGVVPAGPPAWQVMRDLREARQQPRQVTASGRAQLLVGGHGEALAPSRVLEDDVAALGDPDDPQRPHPHLPTTRHSPSG